MWEMIKTQLIKHYNNDALFSKGQCSMFGANGSATIDEGLLQLRALDWNVDGQYNFCFTFTTIVIVVTHFYYIIVS